MAKSQQNVDPAYLIIGGFVLVLLAIYIIVCLYCFLKKKRQKQRKPKFSDAYDVNKHKEIKETKIDGKRTKINFNDKKYVYKAGAYKPIKSGSRVAPCPSGVAKGVAVPMTVDSIATISGENLLAGDAAYNEIIKDAEKRLIKNYIKYF
uniref:Uncharacterized protein n=1 Tax=Meloidogyne hapla TaxID=6305 RepID=A0A1I8B9N5_MELHA